MGKPGPPSAPASPPTPATPPPPSKPKPQGQPTTTRKHNLDNIAEFQDTNMITAQDVETVLNHYNSSLKGNGQDLVNVATAAKLNPAMMLAIIQKESSYGKGGDLHKANPFSIHFRTRGQLQKNEKPIDMLRPSPGTLPTFKQSAAAAANTLNKLAAANNKQPFSSVASKYSEKPQEWKTDINKFYLGILRRVGKL